MLGTAQAALLGSSAQSQPVPQAYTGFVDALNPIRHWPLGELADRTGLFPIAAFGSHETGLPAIAQLDASGNARGFNGFDAYGTIEHDVAYEVAAGGVFVLMQPDQVGTKMQIFNSGTGSVAGSMALEVEDNGQPRAYRRRSDGVLVTICRFRRSDRRRYDLPLRRDLGPERPQAVADGRKSSAWARR